MNCLEFRRQLLTDPFDQDAAATAHENACAACAAYARGVRADEVRLRTLLREIPVPEGLPERVQLAARFESRAQTRRRWWYGAAAGVLLVVGASMVSLWTATVERGGLALAQSVIHHIEDEASHLREARPVPVARVDYVFRRFGAELAGDIGPVHFAAECLMRKRNGIHLVLPGRMGPITVFLMPGEMTDHALPVKSARFAGRIVPTAWGSIAVVGEDGEPLDGLGESLAEVVHWPDSTAAASGFATGRLVGRLIDRLGATQQQDS